MNFPEDLQYTKDHEWLRIADGGKTAIIGISDFAQNELGDIVFVELEPVGTRLAQGEAFGTVEAVKTVSELFMPVTGEISETNDALDSRPEAVNEDPYGDGWMVKVKLEGSEEIESLLAAAEYKEMVGG